MEIKFRAWDKKNKRFLTENDWQKHLSIKLGGGISVLSSTADKYDVDVFEIILQQSTGLFDKNRKEIFDGDIVKHKYAVGEEFKSNGIMVVGSETPDGFKIVGLEMFDPKSSTTYSFDANNEIQEDVEIIGNIYEDKKLIKN